MPLRPLLLLRITLIQEGKVDYFSVFTLLILLVILGLLGAWLWLGGLDLVRSPGRASRLAGAALLALAAVYSVGLVWLGYWQASELIDML